VGNDASINAIRQVILRAARHLSPQLTSRLLTDPATSDSGMLPQLISHLLTKTANAATSNRGLSRQLNTRAITAAAKTWSNLTSML